MLSSIRSSKFLKEFSVAVALKHEVSKVANKPDADREDDDRIKLLLSDGARPRLVKYR
jgi:hypothetical protein